MIQRHQTDEGLLNAIKGNNARDNLQELKTQIALVQAACLLAIEETTRATAQLRSPVSLMETLRVRVSPTTT